MGRQLILAATVPLLALAGCRPTPLTPGASAAFQAFLTTNCPLEREQALANDIRRHAAEIDPHLLLAFANGPPPETAKKIEDYANKQFTAIEAARNRQQRPPGLRPTRAEYVARVRDNYVESYKLTALTGFALTRGSEVLKKLQSVASDPKSPYREEATEILGEVRD